MTVDELRAALAEHQDSLRALGVRSLAVFGSTARGEADDSSDVDLLVELDRRMDLLDYIGIQHYLEDLLGRKVDLVMAEALRTAVRAAVLREAVRAA